MADPATFAPWIKGGSKVEPVSGDKDVFDDGTVVMLNTPGHTPGHHCLLVKLKEKGYVLLSGDLVHFQENYDTNGVPMFNTDRMAETKKDALTAFDAFVETWRVKYDKAVECLIKDREALLAFYDFPAEHWKHLRTTNVIESSFATIRHRTVRSKGSLSNKTALAMIFKLAEAAERSWRRLDGHNQLPKLIVGVKFTDGIEVVRSKDQAAAA
jgi:hypothetical protein